MSLLRPALVATAVLCFLSSGSIAVADAGSDESLPKITLRAGGEQQRGRLWSSTDYTCSAEGGSVGHGDGIPKPQAEGPDLRREPFRGRFLIDRDEEPRIRIDAYSGLDEYGTIEYGTSQKVNWRVRKLPREGEPRRWVVRFKTAAQDDVYLDLTGSWVDPRCDGAKDNGSYVFHVQRSG